MNGGKDNNPKKNFPKNSDRGPHLVKPKDQKKSDVILYPTDRYKLVTPGIKEISKVLKEN